MQSEKQIGTIVRFGHAKKRKKMNQLPNDINMLFSFINMKLRDEYSSLDELCNTMDIEKKWLIEQMETGGFEYNESQNKFW